MSFFNLVVPVFHYGNDKQMIWSQRSLELAVIGATAWWLHAYTPLLYTSYFSCHVFDDLFSFLFPTLCQCSFKLVAHWCGCKPVSTPHDWPAQVWGCIGWLLPWILYATTMLQNASGHVSRCQTSSARGQDAGVCWLCTSRYLHGLSRVETKSDLAGCVHTYSETVSSDYISLDWC